MKIQFTQDYRGVLTNEAYYQSGDVVDLTNGQALIDAGRAVAYKAPAPKPKPRLKGKK
jgi:hypothetical protein